MRRSADIPPHRDFWIKSDIRLPGDASISGWARESLLSYAEGSADADHGLQRLIDWAKARQRPIVTAFFGDHLPPLGPVYVETGFLKDNVAPRKEATAEATLEHHNTPLVIGSNRSGPIEQDAYRFASEAAPSPCA